MEIIAQKISTIELRFVQDIEEGIDEISPFISSLEKIKKHINAVGFSNGFTKEERALWNEIANSLLGETEEKIQGLNATGVDRVHVPD